MYFYGPCGHLWLFLNTDIESCSYQHLLLCGAFCAQSSFSFPVLTFSVFPSGLYAATVLEGIHNKMIILDIMWTI